MFCQRCQKSLRSSEGIKCGACDSRYHLKCVNNIKDIKHESGDKGFHWVCATCQKPANSLADPDAILNAIKTLTEKFDLVNKIQLPKLNNDLMQIKNVIKRLVKQNEDIVCKIDKLKSKNEPKTYRRRDIGLSPRLKQAYEKNPICDENIPILGSNKLFTYRTRRQSYPILKMLLRLNRKFDRRTYRRT